jgi:hypothetical protein
MSDLAVVPLNQDWNPCSPAGDSEDFAVALKVELNRFSNRAIVNIAPTSAGRIISDRVGVVAGAAKPIAATVGMAPPQLFVGRGRSVDPWSARHSVFDN